MASWKVFIGRTSSRWLTPLDCEDIHLNGERIDLRKFSFSQRVVNMWNDLPAEVIMASSVRAFKSKLEAHLSNLPRRSQENRS